MRDKDLVLKCAEYYLDYKWTLQQVAENVEKSVSWVRRALTEDLKTYDYDKYRQVIVRLRKNNPIRRYI